LDKSPDRRPQAAELDEELAQLRREMVGETLGLGYQAKRLLRRRAFWLGAAAVIVLVAIVATVWSGRSRKVRWAREVALPELREMASDSLTNGMAGWQIVSEADPYLKDNAEFQELKPLFAVTTPVRTEPPGVEVFYKPYTEPDAPWLSLGTTPIEETVLPSTYLRWKLDKSGYETVLDVSHAADFDAESGRFVPSEKIWRLEPTDELPEGMILVPGNEEIPAFMVDRHEVSNQQFKQFVDAGGYETPEYWAHEFVQPEGSLDFRSAMALFVDQTGRPGPSTREAGDYPDGTGEDPVTGLSWYEAAAYAEFVDKQLPTIDHWYRATGIFVGPAQWVFTGLLYPASNFGDDGPMAVGASQAMTPLGAVDMAGNVREWCFNQAPAGRCLRGGAWNDRTYMFYNITQADAFDRSPKNGLRCVKYPDRSQIPADLFEPLTFDEERQLLEEVPVSDEVFAAYKAVFEYDPVPLDARIELRHEDNEDWVREKVSYTAPYGDERITALLFLPRNATPPFQAVVYFPGSGAARGTNSDLIEDRGEFQSNIPFLLKTGRAVLHPVYRGTYERRHGIPPDTHWSQEPTLEFTTFQANIIKDVQRSVDFLQSRSDIDADRIAYSGFSWGGQVANLALAVEGRFKAAVINVGGLSSYGTPRPEVDYLNYTPRITLPVLMLNGRYDLALRLESEVQPMFELLGTPDEHKSLIVYETDHWIDRKEVIKETVAWLDTYLGPVQ